VRVQPDKKPAVEPKPLTKEEEADLKRLGDIILSPSATAFDYQAQAITAIQKYKTHAVEILGQAILKENYHKGIHSYIGETLAKIGTPEALDALVRGLGHNERGQHQNSANVHQVLVKVGKPAVPALIRALEKKERHPYFLRSVVFVLGDIKDPQAIPALIEAWDDSEHLHRPIRHVLREFGEPAIPFLIDALKNKNTEIRVGAVETLAEINDARVAPSLIEALNDKNSWVRASAAQELRTLKDPRIVPSLVEAVKQNKRDWQTSYRIYGSLVGLGRTEYKERLSIYESTEKENIDSLVQAGPKAVPVLIQLLEDKEEWRLRPIRSGVHVQVKYILQQTAMKALVKIGDPQAAEPIVRLLESVPLYDTMSDVLIGLGKFGDTKALDLLLKALSHKSPVVRRAAAEALGNFKDPRVVEPLILILSDESVSARRAAVKSLGGIGDSRAVQPLIQMTINPELWKEKIEIVSSKDSDERDLRVAIVQALGDLRDERALDPLIKISGRLRYSHDDLERESLLEAFAKIGNVRAGEIILKLSDGRYPGKMHSRGISVLEKIAAEMKQAGPERKQKLYELYDYLSRHGDLDRKQVRNSKDFDVVEEFELQETRSFVQKLIYGILIVSGLVAALIVWFKSRRTPKILPLFFMPLIFLLASQSSIQAQVSSLPLSHALRVDWIAQSKPALSEIQHEEADKELPMDMEKAELEKLRAIILNKPGNIHPIDREEAVWKLKAYKEKAVPILLEALTDNYWVVRASAASLLGEIKDPKTVPALINAFKDKNIRRNVAEALGKIKDQSAVPALIGGLEENAFDSGIACARALAEINDPRAVQPLISALKSEARYLREAAAQALGQLRSAKDEEESVRVQTALALGNIGDFHALPAMSKTFRNDQTVALSFLEFVAQKMTTAQEIEEKAKLYRVYDLLWRDAKLEREKVQASKHFDAIEEFELQKTRSFVRKLVAGILTALGILIGLIVLFKTKWRKARVIPLFFAPLMILAAIQNSLQAQPLSPIPAPSQYVVAQNTSGPEQLLARDESSRFNELSRVILDDEKSGQEKIKAIYEIKKFGPQAVPILIRAMEPLSFRENDFYRSEVASNAAYALGKIRDPRAIPELIKRVGDPWVQGGRDEVSRALEHMGALAVPELLAALQDENIRNKQDVGSSIIKILGKIQDERAIPSLMKIAANERASESERAGSIYALSGMKVREVVPVMVKALEDTRYPLQVAAVTGLGRIHDPQGIRALIEVLEGKYAVSHSQLTSLQGYALISLEELQALGEVRNTKYIAVLIEILKSRTKGEQPAGKALVIIGMPAVPSILKILGDESQKVRAKAADILGEIKDPASVMPLIQMLADKDWEVRLSAITALGKIKDRRAIPGLLVQLKNNDDMTRLSVVSALGEFKDPETIPALKDLLKDKNRTIRQAIISILGRIQDPRTAAILIDALKTGHWDMRESVATALRELSRHDPKVVLSLIDEMKDRRDGFASSARAAALALGEIKDPRALPALEEVARDKSVAYEVRRGAADSLARIGGPAIPHLINLFMEDADNGRAALGFLEDPQAINTLLESLDQSPDSRRQHAMRYLLTEILKKKPMREHLIKQLVLPENNRWRIETAVALKTQPYSEPISVLETIAQEMRDSEPERKQELYELYDYFWRETGVDRNAVRKSKGFDVVEEVELQKTKSFVKSLSYSILGALGVLTFIIVWFKRKKPNRKNLPLILAPLMFGFALTSGAPAQSPVLRAVMPLIPVAQQEEKTLVPPQAKPLSKEEEVDLNRLGNILLDRKIHAADRHKAFDQIIKYQNYAVPFVIKALESSPEWVRGRMVSFLGASKDPRAVAALIHSLRDPGSWDIGKFSYVTIRNTAIYALAEIQDPRIVPAISKDLKDSLTERDRLEKSREPNISQLAFQTLDGDIQSAIRVLTKKADRRAVPALLEALDFGFANAADGLGEIKNPDVIPTLVKMLGSHRKKENYDFSFAVTRALVKLEKREYEEPLLIYEAIEKNDLNVLAQKGRGAVSILIQGLKSGKVPAAIALGRMKNPADLPVIIKTMQDQYPPVRLAAIYALEETGNTDAVPPLILMLEDREGEVRKATVIALGKMKDSRAVDPLLALWEADGAFSKLVPLVEEALRQILDANRNPDVVPVLRQRLKSENDSLRFFVVRALGNIRNPAAVQSLIEALQDKDVMTRSEAVNGLSRIGDETAVPALIDYFSQESSLNNRRYLLTALGNFRAPVLVPFFSKVSSSDDSESAVIAVKSLGKLGDSRAVDPLLQRFKEVTQDLATDDNNLVLALIDALGDLHDPRAVETLIDAIPKSRFFRFRTLRLRVELALIKIGDVRAVDVIIRSDDHRKNLELIAAEMKEADPERKERLHSLFNRVWKKAGIDREEVRKIKSFDTVEQFELEKTRRFVKWTMAGILGLLFAGILGIFAWKKKKKTSGMVKRQAAGGPGAQVTVTEFLVWDQGRNRFSFQKNNLSPDDQLNFNTALAQVTLEYGDELIRRLQKIHIVQGNDRLAHIESGILTLDQDALKNADLAAIELSHEMVHWFLENQNAKRPPPALEELFALYREVIAFLKLSSASQKSLLEILKKDPDLDDQAFHQVLESSADKSLSDLLRTLLDYIKKPGVYSAKFLGQLEKYFSANDIVFLENQIRDLDSQLLRHSVLTAPISHNVLLSAMANLHSELSQRLDSGDIREEHAGRLTFSLRDLKSMGRFAQRLNQRWNSLIGYLEATRFLYGRRFSGEEAGKKVRDAVYRSLASVIPEITPEQIDALLDRGIAKALPKIPANASSISIGFADLEINPDPTPRLFRPTREAADLVPVETTLFNISQLAYAVEMNRPIFLVGETGVGKTSLVRYLAYLSHSNLRRFNLNDQTDKTDLLGAPQPVFRNGNLGYEWKDGALIEAMKNGYWFILDEMNLAPPEVLERLNSLLDDDGNLTLRENRGEVIQKTSVFDKELIRRLNARGIQANLTEENLHRYFDHLPVPPDLKANIEVVITEMNQEGIYRIHHRFRLFATGNPVSYEGRKRLSPAYLNRFLVQWVESMTPAEQVKVLSAKYKIPEKAVEKIVALSEALNLSLKDFKLGKNVAEQPPYVFTFRHMERIFERLARKSNWSLGDLARIAYRMYGLEMRTPEDQKILQELLKKIFGTVSYRENIEFDETGERVTLGQGEFSLDKRQSHSSFVPLDSHRLIPVDTTRRHMKHLAEAVSHKEKPLLAGPTAAAKTSLIRYLALLTHNSFSRIGLDAQTDTSELLGSYLLSGTQADGSPVIQWKDGVLINALRFGHWLLLDEINLAAPEILERINSLLDDDASMELTEHEGEVFLSLRDYWQRLYEFVPKLLPQELKGTALSQLTETQKSALQDELTRRMELADFSNERGKQLSLAMERLEKEKKIIPIHPSFKLFAALNPSRYAGRKKLSPAFRNKFTGFWIDGEFPDQEIVTILQQTLKSEHSAWAPKMVQVYREVEKAIQARRIGRENILSSEDAPYHFTLRGLKHWAQFINEKTADPLKPLTREEAFIAGASSVFYDRMETVRDKEAFEEILRQVFADTPHALSKFQDIWYGFTHVSEDRYAKRLETIRQGVKDNLVSIANYFDTLTESLFEGKLEDLRKRISENLTSKDKKNSRHAILALILMPRRITQNMILKLLNEGNAHQQLATLELLYRLGSFYRPHQNKEKQDIAISTVDFLRKIEVFKTKYGPDIKYYAAKILKRLKSSHESRMDLKGRDIEKFLKKQNVFGVMHFSRLLMMSETAMLLLTGGMLLAGPPFVFWAWIFLIGMAAIPVYWRIMSPISLWANEILQDYASVSGELSKDEYFELLKKWQAAPALKVSETLDSPFLNILGEGRMMKDIVLWSHWLLTPALGIVAVAVMIWIWIGFFASLAGRWPVILEFMPVALLLAGAAFMIAALRDFITLHQGFKEEQKKSEELADDEFERRHSIPAEVVNQFGLKDYLEAFEEVKLRRDEQDEAGEESLGSVKTRRRFEFPDLVPEQVEWIKDKNAWRFYNAFFPRNQGLGEKLYVPADEISDLTPISSTVRSVEKIAHAASLRQPVFLVGNTGVGKTSLIRYLANKSGNNLRRFNLNGQTDKSELIGSFRPVPNGKNAHLGYAWRDGILVEALKKGYWLVLDEMNLAESEILERLNSLLDDDISLTLREHLGEKLISFEEFDKKTLALLTDKSVTAHDLIEYHEDRLNDQGKAALIQKAVGQLNSGNVFRIHHLFRLFATGNPLDYAGRNVLSPAYLDRWQTKIIDEPTSGELVQILLDRYGQSDGWLKIQILSLERFHHRLVHSARTGKIATDERGSLEFTIRHLGRVLNRYRDVVEENGKMETKQKEKIFARAISEVYLAGLPLHPQLEEFIDQQLRTFFTWDVSALLPRQDSGASVEEKGDSVEIGSAKLYRKKQRWDPGVPRDGAQLPLTPSFTTNLETVAKSVELGEHVLLTGPTAAGKTSLVRYLSFLTRNVFTRIGLDGQTDTSELMGQYLPSDLPGSKAKTRWQNGILIEALEAGHWVLLDEVNLARPEILERINSLLDDDASLELTEHEGEVYRPVGSYVQALNEILKSQGIDVTSAELSSRIITEEWQDSSGETIHSVMQLLAQQKKLKVIHPNFRLFAAQNPKSYAGRNRLSKAFRNKFNEIWMNGKYTGEEYEAIVNFFSQVQTLPLAAKDTEILGRLFFALQEAVLASQFRNFKVIFTLRDLRSIIHYLAVIPNAKLSEAVNDVLGGRFDLEKDKEIFSQILHKVGIKAVTESFPDGLSPIPVTIGPRSVTFGGITLLKRKNLSSDSGIPLNEIAKLEPTGRTVHYLQKLAKAVLLGEQTYLIGSTGIGKTSFIRYLASLTNNNYSRFNLNIQTDKMEMLGGFVPKEDGSLGYRWVDGILVRALRRGDWLVLDEMNLAPPEVLERLNSLFDDDQSLALREHRGEHFISAKRFDSLIVSATRAKGVSFGDIPLYFDGALADEVKKKEIEKAKAALESRNTFRIHHDFKLFATGNPESYAGRQAQSPAFLNRFRLWQMQNPAPAEIKFIMRQKYPQIPQLEKLVDFHLDLAGWIEKEAAASGLHFTIRNLDRALSRVNSGAGVEESFGDIYGMASGADPKVSHKFAESFNTYIGPLQDVIPPSPQTMNGTLEFAGLQFKIDASSRDRTIPAEEVSRLEPVPTTLKQLKKVANAIYFKEPLLLTGETAVAKTSLVRFLAHHWKVGFERVVLDGQTDTGELVGNYSVDTQKTGGVGLAWGDGPLIQAMRHGRLLLLDELNLASPEILERINPLLDDDASLVVTEHKGETWRSSKIYDAQLLKTLQAQFPQMTFSKDELKRYFEGGLQDAAKTVLIQKIVTTLENSGAGIFRIHDKFRIVGAQNPATDEGRKHLSIAFRNKFTEIPVQKIRDVGELKAIVKAASARSEVRSGEKPEKLTPEERDLLASLRTSFEAVYRLGAEKLFKIEPGPGWTMRYHGTKTAEAQSLVFPVDDLREASNIEKRIDELDAEVQNKPAVYDKPSAFGSFMDDIIRETIWEKKKAYTKTTWFGRPKENTALSRRDRRALVEVLKKIKRDGLLASIYHEGSHYDITRPSKYVFEKETRRALFNAIEDPRVNTWIERSYNGGEHLIKIIYDQIFPERTQISFDKHGVLPHLQFTYGIIYRWRYGKNHPGIKNKTVLKALNDLWPSIEKAYYTLPSEQLRFTRLSENDMAVTYSDGRREKFTLPNAYQETTRKAPPVKLDNDNLVIEREKDGAHLSVTRRILKQTGDLETDLEVKESYSQTLEMPEINKTLNVVFEKNPSENDKFDAAEKFERILKEEIEPRYEELVEESKKQMKAQGAGQKSKGAQGPGQQGEGQSQGKEGKPQQQGQQQGQSSGGEKSQGQGQAKDSPPQGDKDKGQAQKGGQGQASSQQSEEGEGQKQPQGQSGKSGNAQGQEKGKQGTGEELSDEEVSDWIEKHSKEFADKIGAKVENQATKNAKREAEDTPDDLGKEKIGKGEKEATSETGEESETLGDKTNVDKEKDKTEKDRVKTLRENLPPEDGETTPESGSRDINAEDEVKNISDGQKEARGQSKDQTGEEESEAEPAEKVAPAPPGLPNKKLPDFEGPDMTDFDYEEFLRHLEEHQAKPDTKKETKTRGRSGDYSQAKQNVNYLIERFVSFLENILYKDMRPRFKGWYRMGKKLDRRKAVQSLAEYEAKGVFNDKIWMKKVLPEKRSYKFSYIVDMSGSMEGHREEVIKSVVLFMNTLEALDIDFNLYWYSSEFEQLKPFGKKLSEQEKDRMIDRLKNLNMQGTDERAVLVRAIEELKKQEGDSKHIILFTDGQTRAAMIAPLLKEARQAGIFVTAIGYRSMGGVTEHTYKDEATGLVVEDMEDLIYRLAEVLKKSLLDGRPGRSEVRSQIVWMEEIRKEILKQNVPAYAAVSIAAQKILRDSVKYNERLGKRVEEKMATNAKTESLSQAGMKVWIKRLAKEAYRRETVLVLRPEISVLPKSDAITPADSLRNHLGILRKSLRATEATETDVAPVPVILSTDDLSPALADNFFRFVVPAFSNPGGKPLIKLRLVAGRNPKQASAIRNLLENRVKEFPFLSSVVVWERNPLAITAERYAKKIGFVLAGDTILKNIPASVLSLGFDSGKFGRLSYADQSRLLGILLMLGYQIRRNEGEGLQSSGDFSRSILRYAFASGFQPNQFQVENARFLLSDISASLMRDFLRNQFIQQMA